VSKEVFRGTRETEEVNLRRESGGNSSRKKSLKSSLKISGQDSFREEGGERFQTIRSGKLRGG
jgi:hypothetical protein